VGLQTVGDDDVDSFKARFNEVADYLETSRPTAVNLFWAMDRLRRCVSEHGELDGAALRQRLLEEAKAIHAEDREMCHSIGKHGANLLSGVSGVLTHCNAGGLATAEYGTALSVFFTAQDQGHDLHVFVDETRPKVQAVVTGADRIAANGDSANKIGTYSIAVLARAHGIPFYIAAPSSTFDLSIASGAEIPIELRGAEEITNGFGRQTAPDGVEVYNPAFDVTPAEYIHAIITEKGVIDPVSTAQVAAVVG